MRMINLEGENNPKSKPIPKPKWRLFLHHILIARIIYPMAKQAGTRTCLNSLWGHALDNFRFHNSHVRTQHGRKTTMRMEMDKPVHTCSVISVLSLKTAAFVFQNLYRMKEKEQLFLKALKVRNFFSWSYFEYICIITSKFKVTHLITISSKKLLLFCCLPVKNHLIPLLFAQLISHPVISPHEC